MNSSAVEKILGGAYSGVHPLRRGPNDNIYIAFDQDAGAKVFIKLVDGNRFRRELNVFALPLRDQIVAPTDTVFVDKARCALVYPWYSSGSLRRWLRRRSIWTPDLIKRLAADLLVALRCLHSQGMLHGDIKPENILVRREGKGLRFCLSDFGSSAYFQEVEQKRWRSASPAYEAPESVDGHPTPHSDLYSVGIVLFEALNGSVPFRGMPSEIYRQARHTIPGLSNVSSVPLRNLLSRLLQNDIRQRPAHASEALSLLGGSIDDLSIMTRSATVVPAGFIKRSVHSTSGYYDTVLSSEDGQQVAFQVGCSCTVRACDGSTIRSIPCSNVPPAWHDGRLYLVQGSDLWCWDPAADVMKHVRWLRHVPDAIAVSSNGQAWLSNHWLFYAHRGSDKVVKSSLDGFLRSDQVALTDDRCYVAEGNCANKLVCRDRNLVVRWKRELDGSIEDLRVHRDGQIRVLIRTLERSATREIQTFDRGICRQRVALDPLTRSASITRDGCIAWLKTGQIRIYSFSLTGRIQRQRLFPSRSNVHCPASRMPAAKPTESRPKGELKSS